MSKFWVQTWPQTGYQSNATLATRMTLKFNNFRKLLFVVLFLFCFLFGGFKGQVRATSLGPKPSLFSYLFCFCCFFSFPFFASNRQTNPVFPLEKRHFLFIFECLPLFLLSLFLGLPLFNSSFSVSLWLFSLVFPDCLSFLLSFCSFFFFLFSFFSSLLLFHEKHHIKLFNCNFFVSSVFSFFGYPLLFVLSNPFLLSLLFADFKLCFLFNINVFWLKKPKLKNTNYWSKGGCNKTVFFMNLCFAKCEKWSFLFGHFFGKFWLMFKNTINIGISALF